MPFAPVFHDGYFFSHIYFPVLTVHLAYLLNAIEESEAELRRCRHCYVALCVYFVGCRFKIEIVLV